MANDSSFATHAQLVRVGTGTGVRIPFFINGQRFTAYEGDTVLTAILASTGHLRCTEFLGLPRAGFCLMGACQDCWVRCASGSRIRACSTLITSGMALVVPAQGASDE